MYYRRKIIIALLQQFGGSLTRTDLQKLMFIYSTKQSEPTFDFIPYKYGCFSYQANQDLSTMRKYELIDEVDSKLILKDNANYINQLKMKDRIELVKLYQTFKNVRGEKLLKYVYENYPYYAINSEISQKVLDEDHLKKVKAARPSKKTYTLFTIGYEGKSVESFVNQLIKEDVKVLCDVRNNPFSMKYGFSKNQLKYILENVGIKYIHFPELGIESDKRQELNSKKDYEILFKDYEKNTLPFKEKELKELYTVFITNKRIALTCFEADYQSCHRSRLSKAIEKLFDKDYVIKHI